MGAGMKFSICKGNYSFEETFYLVTSDGVDEALLCVKNQYPKMKGVITCINKNVNGIEGCIIIVGIKLPKRRKK